MPVTPQTPPRGVNFAQHQHQLDQSQIQMIAAAQAQNDIMSRTAAYVADNQQKRFRR